MIVYRQDKFRPLGWEPTDWSDLWRSELKQRLSLIDQPREIIGLTLKSLGASYNTPDLDKIPQLRSQLKQLQQQVKFYSSTHYLQPLILGDTWVAVGWSSDILSILSNQPNLKAAIPSSGTSLWADLWVKPAAANPDDSSIADRWIDFCWQSSSASLISVFSRGISPVILTQPSEKLLKESPNNPLLGMKPEILGKSEFILPLTEESQNKYLDLWKEIRQASPDIR
jgi:putative spermidine/putrescine transport system substrate-binding protein